MKIAMPYQDGVLLEHFGRAKEFIIYNVSDLDPVTSEVIAPEDLSHAAVARALKEHGVDVVLCGSIGEHARQAVEGEHMLVFSGITGAADDVLERFLQGNMEAADGELIENCYPGLSAIQTQQLAVYMCMMNPSPNGDVVLVQVKDSKDVDAVKAILQARIQYMVGDGNGPGGAWYPEPTEMWENNSRIVTHGNYVMMVADFECENIVNAFNALF